METQQNNTGKQTTGTLLNNPQKAISLSGIAFIYTSVIGYILIIVLLYARTLRFDDELLLATSSYEYIQKLSVRYFPILLIFIASILTNIVGYKLLTIAGASTKEVIPRNDYPLLSSLLLEEKDKGIDLYIKLNSLTGLTGVFTKIGISGLPLATIALTLFFTVMGSYFTGNTKLLDLANLTLGAFLGSYVQRQASSVSTRSTRDNSQTNGH